jgi:uncharacterized protein with HEPN domain
MLDAGEAIGRYVDRGRAAFDRDLAIRDAIVYQIVVIGEAAKAVLAADPAIAVDFPEVEWSLLARMRDKVTHQYWAVDPEIVWSTAERDMLLSPGVEDTSRTVGSGRCLPVTPGVRRTQTERIRERDRIPYGSA